MAKHRIGAIIVSSGKRYIVRGIVHNLHGISVIDGFDYALEECNEDNKPLHGTPIKYCFEDDIANNTIQ